MRVKSIMVAIGLLSSAAPAQQVEDANATYADNVLVTAQDVTTCPYRFLGPITISASVEFNKRDIKSMYEKLRLKGIEMGADAVVLVTIGKSHITAFSWGKKNATGRAIQYLDRSCAPKG